MVNKLKQHLFFLLRIPSECIYAFVQSFSHWISGWSSGHSKCNTVRILNLHHWNPFLLSLISWTTDPEDRSQKIYNRDTKKTTGKIQVAHSWSSQEQPASSCWPWFCQQKKPCNVTHQYDYNNLVSSTLRILEPVSPEECHNSKNSVNSWLLLLLQ